MPLDSARMTSLGSADTTSDVALGAPSPAPRTAWGRAWALVDMTQLARRPRWLLVTLLTALMLAGMPVVHASTFGAARLADATVAHVESLTGERLPSEGRAMVRHSVLERSVALIAGASTVGAVLALLLTGMTLHGGALLTGIPMSGAQALAITGVVSGASALVRVFLWSVPVMLLDRGTAIAPDWMQVGAVTLAHFVDAGSPVIRTLYGGLDAVRLAGVALAVLCITTMHPGTSVARATVAASCWMIVVLLLRLGLSALLHIPIL